MFVGLIVFLAIVAVGCENDPVEVEEVEVEIIVVPVAALAAPPSLEVEEPATGTMVQGGIGRIFSSMGNEVNHEIFNVEWQWDYAGELTAEECSMRTGTFSEGGFITTRSLNELAGSGRVIARSVKVIPPGRYGFAYRISATEPPTFEPKELAIKEAGEVKFELKEMAFVSAIFSF